MEPTRLYFIHMTGCPACESAVPGLKVFARKHPDVRVVKVDLTVVPWKRQDFDIDKTPTYILRRPDGSMERTEGARSARQLESWFREHASD